MPTPREEVVAELSRLIAASEGPPGPESTQARYRLHAAIKRHAPAGSPLRSLSDKVAGQHQSKAIYELRQMATALRDDFSDGYLRTIEGRVQEAIFDDFLDMAEHIRQTAHFAPATVLAGGVLEEHVRKLAAAAGDIDLIDAKGRPRAFEQLCHDLVRKEVLTEPERKVLAAWYGQRTEAAHHRIQNVIEADVPRMIEGVRDFIARHPI